MAEAGLGWRRNSKVAANLASHIIIHFRMAGNARDLARRGFELDRMPAALPHEKAPLHAGAGSTWSPPET